MNRTRCIRRRRTEVFTALLAVVVATGCSGAPAQPKNGGTIPSIGTGRNRPLDVKNDLGFVLDVEGDWFLNGSALPLDPGDGLPAGAKIEPGADTTDDNRLLVAMRWGAVHQITKDQLELPTHPESDQPHRSWTLALHGQRKFISAQSRGFDETSFSDAVVQKVGVELHIAPVFANLPDRDYRLILEAASDGSSDRPAEVRVPYAWNSNSQPTMLWQAKSDGAFTVKIQPDPPDDDGEFETALILVSASPQFERLAAEFEDARRLVSGWGDTVPQPVARRFLQATLMALSNDDEE